MSKRDTSSLNGAPIPDEWYTLTLGSSFKDHPNPRHPSPKLCTLRYDFLPASVDKTQPGLLHRRKDKEKEKDKDKDKNNVDKINVELNNVQPGKPKFNFEGSGEDLKENDAVMYFDGTGFRLERLHRAVNRLKLSRPPAEQHVGGGVGVGASVDHSSPPVGRAPGKGQGSGVSNRVSSFTPPRPLPPPPPLPPVSVEVERFDIGEIEPIGAIEVERIDIGEVERIDTGEFERFDIGDAERMDIDEVEQIDVGDVGMSGGKSRNDKPTSSPPSEQDATVSPDSKDFDLEAHLDIMNDDDDEDDAVGPTKSATAFTGIDINLPHQNETDDEIADVDVNDDNAVVAGNAAAALRALVHKEEKDEQTSSSSASSGSDSSSDSESGSGSSHSSSDTDNTVDSI